MAKRKSPAHWVKGAMDASDLLQGYVDLAMGKIEDLQPESRIELRSKIEKYRPHGPEEAGAKAILIWLLDNIENEDE